jgi:hypothetical protein
VAKKKLANIPIHGINGVNGHLNVFFGIFTYFKKCKTTMSTITHDPNITYTICGHYRLIESVKQ